MLSQKQLALVGGPLLLLGIACATDHVEVSAITITKPDGSDPSIASLLVESKLDGDDLLDGDPGLFLRFNGRNAFVDGEERVELFHNGGLSAGIEPGDYVVEVVDEDDVVLLRTALLSFQAGHVNSLAIVGKPTSLESLYHSTVWTAVPSDRVIAAFGNGNRDHTAGRLDICEDGGSCVELVGELEHGASWAGEVNRLAHFRFVPDIEGGDQLNIRSVPLGLGFDAPTALRFAGFVLAGWKASSDEGCSVGCADAAQFGEFRPTN